jgi:hypothetical protein
MALLHSVLVALLRHPAEGEDPQVIVAQATGISGRGTVSAPVVEAYHQLMSSSPEAVEARRRYSALVLIVDNGHRANHEFPDLDAAEANKAKAAEIREAAEEQRRAEARAASLRKQLAEVEDTQSKAGARLANLTGMPIDPVVEPVAEEEVEENTGEGTGELPPVEPAAPVGAEIDPPVDPVLVIAARLTAGEVVTPDELAVLTVEQLRSLGERYEIPMPAAAKKADLIELLLQEEPEA